jgi:hypothetical protein
MFTRKTLVTREDMRLLLWRENTVKKIALTIFVLVLVASLCVPALADDTTIQTGVEIAPAGGEPPIIKCKWETPDDGDLLNETALTQILPPGRYQQTVPIFLWAIITDPQGTDTVAKAYADVFHPVTPPECGSFKYQVPLYKVDKETVGIPAFEEAWANGLVTLGPGITYEDIMHQLSQCLCDVWMGQEVLDYHQPAGEYRVEVYARDVKDNWSDLLINHFLYVPTTACEFDFDQVYYGSVDICYNKWIGGDMIFDESMVSMFPTVRNIGNTNLRVTVWQDDMGLGETSGEGWNVEFDARLGATGMDVQYFPFPDPAVILPDILPLCNTQKLDFSIHVIKGMSNTPYSGNMTLGCVGAEWIGSCSP